MKPTSPIEAQVAEARRTISSDGYPMSIGELTNLYKEGELIIRPEFQRFFRWKTIQKSRLVESLLLGIPLPSIFVAQDDDGKWELVDGLQRVSTILELQGELLDEGGNRKPALVLEGTKYIPALEGATWESINSYQITLSPAQRLDIKRSKIDLKIIKRDSSREAKYDLFQRLNSYGTPLTAQETRSALLVASSPEFFSWITSLSRHPTFVSSTDLGEHLVDERFDLELVLRFLILHARTDLSVGSLRDFSQLLDTQSMQLASDFPSNREALEHVFKRTFDTIENHGGDFIFKKWDATRQRFKGPFLLTAFEVFALGIGYHVANSNSFRTDIIDVAKSFWELPNMQGGFATGRSTERRLADFVPLGRQLLALAHGG